MLLAETAIFYLLLGVTVAAAVYLRGRNESKIEIGLMLTAACLFWPLFVPVLLSASSDGAARHTVAPQPSQSHPDSLDSAILQVETELDTALGGLDGWAEDVLNSEQHRLEELRAAWKVQADRIRQIDRVLTGADGRNNSLAVLAGDTQSARKSETTRQDNLRQLSKLRDRMHAELVGTLAWVRELVTMIHLAKFSGAPAARAEELVAQIAAAVQGLSEVSVWREHEFESLEIHETA